MRRLACCFVMTFTMRAADIPAGTNLEIRLITPVSTSSSHVKDPVEAMLIAPVVMDRHAVIAAPTALSGFITAITPATEQQRATLRFEFNKIAVGTHAARISTRVFSVDNARETVDANGTVLGIDPKEAITHRIDQGLGKLSNSRMSGLAQVLGAAKTFLLKEADPNVAYDTGTEMTLRLLKPLDCKAFPSPAPEAPVPDDGNLTALVNGQVWQTFAARPLRPSDVTNLLFIGPVEQVTEAFREGGWGGAQALSGESKFETARAIIEQRGYKEAPVSLILLNGRAPDLVLQKGTNTFSARHHLRLWHSPDTYAGQDVWLCAATHDIGIDFSEEERTFIHKIDSRIDLERTKVTNDLMVTGRVRGITLVDRPEVPTHFRNGTGDDVNTDGRMAVLQF